MRQVAPTPPLNPQKKKKKKSCFTIRGFIVRLAQSKIMAAARLDANWTVALDNKLAEFWSQHECLYNPLNCSYSDKELKTQLWSQLAGSLGKHVSDVEKRVRSLRAQYGRMLLKPLHEQHRYAAKRKTLRKLNFLKPFVQRKCTTRALGVVEQKCEDEEEVENREEDEDIDQGTGSVYGSPIDYNVSDSEPNDESEPLDSAPNAAALRQTPAQHLNGEIPPPDSQNVPKEAPPIRTDARVQDNDNLERFSQITLADMREIKSPFILMRLRRDITNLVFQAVQDDLMHRRGRSASFSAVNNGGYDRTTNNRDAGAAQPPLGPMASSARCPPHSRRRKEHDERQRWKWEETQKKRRKASKESASRPPQPGEREAERRNETDASTVTPSQTLVIKTETDRYEIEIDSLILS